MDGHRVGVLHPGSMGAAVAAQAVAAGSQVHWLPEGRGEATRQRAEAAGLLPVADLAALADACDLIISVCPPAAARQVAESVAATSFTGVYLEANAISPRHTEEIADLLAAGGVTVVDGGIVGPPPPRRPAATTLYLAGPDDAVTLVSEAFAGSALTVTALEGRVGSASALKLSFASYNKISSALAAQACALAASHGVLDDLLALAAEALPETPLGRANGLAGAGARAWRWAPEMREIAEACASSGVSPDLALAAAALFEQWNDHKDDPDVPLEQLIADLVDSRAVSEIE